MPSPTALTRRPQIGETAPHTVIQSAEDGAAFPLERLWQNGPAVLIFLRHFG